MWEPVLSTGAYSKSRNPIDNSPNTSVPHHRVTLQSGIDQTKTRYILDNGHWVNPAKQQVAARRVSPMAIMGRNCPWR